MHLHAIKDQPPKPQNRQNRQSHQNHQNLRTARTTRAPEPADPQNRQRLEPPERPEPQKRQKNILFSCVFCLHSEEKGIFWKALLNSSCFSRSCAAGCRDGNSAGHGWGANVSRSDENLKKMSLETSWIQEWLKKIRFTTKNKIKFA